jgi:PAS domain S-box-containing protein
MNRILLLASDRLHRERLADWLSARYDVLFADGSEVPPLAFDLAIVDSGALVQHGEWLKARKDDEFPVLLPVLFLGTSEELSQQVPQKYWLAIDEILSEDAEQIEVQFRLGNLFRTRHATLELQLEHERLLYTSKAVESISDGIIIADVNGTAIYNNQAFIDLYGYTVNELNVRGIPASLFTDHDIANEIFATMREGRTWSGEVELTTKTGELVPTLMRADSIRDEAGKPIGLISVCTDITEYKMVQAAEHRQRVLAEALRDIASGLTSTLDLGEVLKRILTNIGRVVPHDAAYIMLIENGEARVVRMQGFRESAIEEWLTKQPYQVEQVPELYQMAVSGQPIVVPSLDASWYENKPKAMRRFRSYTGAPIRLKGKTIGFLHLNSVTPNFFTVVHAERLQAFADQAAIAIQNAQLHEKAQALAVLEERQRLARDLHDAVSQTLFSAAMIAEALPRLWDRQPERAREQLHELYRLTRGAQAEMRTLLLELRPATLLEANLEELLSQLAAAVIGRTRMNVTLNIEGDMKMPGDVQTAYYYIAQEAFNNIVKHSRARQVDVHVTSTPEVISLRISDDGRGFDTSQIPATSLGLGIMRERADAIGAELHVNSVPGKGTTVTTMWFATNGRKVGQHERIEKNPHYDR